MLGEGEVFEPITMDLVQIAVELSVTSYHTVFVAVDPFGSVT